jgi:hypothetical protein
MADDRIRHRNPRPARGPDILTLTQLRHYVRLFWTDRRYGICGLAGGKQAFLRFCGGDPVIRHAIHYRLLLGHTEWLPEAQQRLLSRKVGQILRGEVIFIEVAPRTATFRPMLGAPEPPIPGAVPFYDHQFRLEHTVMGPKIRRI